MKAAKEAADLAAAKTKETYDLLIPAQIDWFEPMNLSLSAQTRNLKGEHSRAAHLSHELCPNAVCQSVAR